MMLATCGPGVAWGSDPITLGTPQGSEPRTLEPTYETFFPVGRDAVNWV
jgi:hypothetical protein